MNDNKAFLYTLLVHVGWFLLFCSGGWHSSSPKKEKMVVVTKEFVKPKPIKIAKAAPPVVKTVPVAKNAPVIAKKTSTSTAPKKIVKKADKPKQKHPTPSKQLLKKIDQNLNKIHNPSPKTPPSPVISTPSDEEETTTFLDRISLIFQETLTLPEKGAVKLTISVQPNGKIVIMDLIHKESESNLQYLKLMLPLITLPPPEGGKEQTFMITFCND